jgi:hypothetical protein
MPLYQCLPPTGYSNRGADWLNPSAQLNRMNFAIDLAANRIGGVTMDMRGLARGADMGNPRALASTLSGELGALSARTLDTVARLDTRMTNPSAASRTIALLLASPEFQEK